MKRWQAVVFDLDDTLYSERDYVLSGMRAVADWARDSLGFPAEQTYGQLHDLFEAGVRGETFDRWALNNDLQPEACVPAMVDVYYQHQPRITLEANTIELLSQLRELCRLGIITDGYLNVQQRKTAALGLDRTIQTIVYSDAFGRDAWKPDPRPFHAVLERLEVPADRAVYVGDNPAKDFFGARRVGMETIRIRRPDGLHRDLEPATADHAPDREIDVLTDLHRLASVSSPC